MHIERTGIPSQPAVLPSINHSDKKVDQAQSKETESHGVQPAPRGIDYLRQLAFKVVDALSVKEPGENGKKHSIFRLGGAVLAMRKIDAKIEAKFESSSDSVQSNPSVLQKVVSNAVGHVGARLYFLATYPVEVAVSLIKVPRRIFEGIGVAYQQYKKNEISPAEFAGKMGKTVAISLSAPITGVLAQVGVAAIVGPALYSGVNDQGRMTELLRKTAPIIQTLSGAKLEKEISAAKKESKTQKSANVPQTEDVSFRVENDSFVEKARKRTLSQNLRG
jgi:hypothetical protein